jgi:hypothetical protein
MNARRAIVKGEEELGRQRYCRTCDEWWPDDEEFFGRTRCRDGYVRSWCRACRLSQWAATHHGRKRVAA